jgi:tripartite-type tricarboxylate transporter receptor subunit TctC
MTESGLDNLSISSWAGIFGPAKLPALVTGSLSTAVNSILMRDDVRAEFSKQGFEASGSTPEELGIYVKTQLRVWRDAVKTAGIVPD